MAFAFLPCASSPPPTARATVLKNVTERRRDTCCKTVRVCQWLVQSPGKPSSRNKPSRRVAASAPLRPAAGVASAADSSCKNRGASHSPPISLDHLSCGGFCGPPVHASNLSLVLLKCQGRRRERVLARYGFPMECAILGSPRNT